MEGWILRLPDNGWSSLESLLMIKYYGLQGHIHEYEPTSLYFRECISELN